MAIGFDIVIPDRLISKLAQADKRLKTISQTSEETKNRVVRAFNQMTLGADEFLKKLQQINTEMGKLGNVKLQITTTNTTQSVDDINKLIQLTKDLTDAQKKQLEAQARAELTKRAKSDAQETTKRQISEEQKLTAQIKAQNAELSAEYKRRSKENIAIADNEARKRIAASRLATNEIIAQMQRETRFRIQEANRIAKLTQMPTTITRKDVGRIIDVSRNATSINQMQTAIKNLEKAKRDLDTTDKKYDKTIKAINKEIENQKQRLKELGVQMDNYKSKSSNLLNISEQLTRRLALVFSVSQVTGYVKKLASVRGEFELQQKSLAAIIQNKDKANEVFDKITQLAVKSPFQLKELVTYTKQLAAYKIQTDKLYDSTKMLADLSAGVGVGMDRLVLAYGQVASANYLRGTELRQFSEAGINVLGELSKYFTEIQNRVVSVAEVFDMVSRRMVSFKDVEAVLTRMTQKGGEFYGMQAVQAETLKGQLSNLKDAVDIMLNDIGKANEGVLKNSVALVRNLVENWRTFSYIIEDVGFILGAITLSNFIKGLSLTEIKLLEVAANGRGAIAMAARLKQGFLGLSGVLSKIGGSTLGWIGIVLMLIKTGHDWCRSVKAQNAIYDETINTLGNLSDKATKIVNDYEIATQSFNAAQEKIKEISESTEENTESQEDLNKALLDSHYARQTQIDLLEKLKTEFPEIYKGLKQEEDGTINLTEAIQEFNNTTMQRMALQQAMKGGWLTDDFKSQVADAEEELKEYDNVVENLFSTATRARNVIKSFRDELNKSDLEALKILDTAYFELNAENKKNILKQLDKISGMSSKVKKVINEVKIAQEDVREAMWGTPWEWGAESSIANLIRIQYPEVLKQFKGSLKNLSEEVDITTDIGKIMMQNLYNSLFKELGIVHPILIERMQNKFKKDLKEFSFIWTFKPKGVKIDSSGAIIDINEPEWQKAIKDELLQALKQLPKLEDEIFKDFLSLSPSGTFEIPMPNFDKEKGIIESYEDWVKRFKQAWDVVKNVIEKAHGKDQALFTDEQRSLLDSLGAGFEFAAKAAGLVKTETEDVEDKTSEQIRVIKELHEAYLDLSKTFDTVTAKQGAIDKFGNAFKEAFDVDVSKWGFDFTTEEGVVAAFDKLIKSIPDQKKRVQAELAKGEFVMEFKIQAQKNADKEVTDQISKMFNDYESLLELDKLGISGAFAKKYFNIDSIDLAEIRKKIEDELSKAEAEGGREDFVKERKKELEKVTEMEVKAQQERLQIYLKYTRDAISERAKIEFDAMRKIEEAKKTFDENDPLLDDAIDGIKREMNAALQTLDWKEFSSSDTFVSIFNDLEDVSTQALTSMIDQLEKYKNEWTDLPIDQMEAVAKQLEKMKKARDVNEAVAKPFMSGAFAGGRLNAKDISQAQQDMIDADKSILASNQQVSNMEYLLEMLYEEKNLADQSIVSQERLRELGIDTTKSRADQEKIIQKIIEEEQANVNQQNQYKQASERTLSLAEKQKAVLQAQSEYLGEDLQMANDLYDAFSGLYEALGGDKDNPVAIFADMGMSMANTVIQTIQLQIQLNIAAQEATGLGIAMNAAMGVIGWIVMSVQLLTQAISAITKAHDNALQKQIERDAEAVELLQKRFEKLEKAIDNAMSFGKYQKEFDEAKRNLDEQIRLTRDMIALEEAKKKTDKDAIKGYKDEIEDYNEQLKEMEEKRISDMGGFGSDEAYKDAAQSFIDAWLSAYKETGDGLEALQGQWDEYFDNLVKKQMIMHIANKYIKGLLEQVDKAIGADGIVTGDEMSNLKAMAEQSSIEWNAIMKQFADAFGIEGLTDGTKLEGLSESIQGVTEVTAQALEAILNSMRFYVIDNNKQLIDIANTLLSWESPTSPILAELKAQTSYLSSIESLFNSVVDRNGSPAVRVR